MLVWCKVNTSNKNALINIVSTIKIDSIKQIEGKYTFGTVLNSPIKSDIGKQVNIIGYGIYNRPKLLN